MGRRGRYTPEEIEGFKAADKALNEGAGAVLSDPEALSRVVATVVSAKSPRILRFSLRNQVLLMNQAEAHGITLSDVDTHWGWRERGRGVREEEFKRPLRITRPRGREKAAEGEAAGGDAAGGEASADTENGENEGRTRFRMMSVYDISQTDGADEAAEGYEALTVEDPAAEMLTALTGQLERYGYSVRVGDVAAAEVCDDPQTVTVPAGDGQAVELARALGSLLSRPKGERPTPIPGDAACITDDGTERVRFDLDEYGTVLARITDDRETGTTFYRIDGTRVRGVFSVSSHDAARMDFHAADVAYGKRVGPFENATENPIVNGIPLKSGTSGLTPQDVEEELRSWRINAWRADTNGRAPERTAERVAAVVRAILRHWFARDDLQELHAARARAEAPYHRSTAQRAADQLTQQIERLTRERDESADAAAHYAELVEQPAPEQTTETEPTA